jgi:GT2 family glycosyltransferase
MAWRLLPAGVRGALAPYVYPVAAGPRGSGFVLAVPPGLEARPLEPGANAKTPPTVSIVIVTHDNPALCGACLRGLFRNTPWPGLQVIVIDNGSPTETRALLEEHARADPRLSVIRNDENRGFAPAANQGLRAARGDIVVLLNDDTVVGPEWLPRLVAHLERNPRLGMVCPVTNEIGNAARIDVTYSTFEAMEEFAIERAGAHAGELREASSLALFCAAARRSVLVEAGFLDERYAIGMFEDDDLSLTLRRRGFSLGIAQDAFVHHVGQASFSRLGDPAYLRVWSANRRRFEAKWGVRWKPPDRR